MMRIEGTLAKWNDDRGFGFIAPTQGGSEVFVHISAFPRDGQRPRLGEQLTFEIQTGKDGRKSATNLLCPDRPTRRPAPRPATFSRRERRGILGRIAPVIVIALAVYGYSEYSGRVTAESAMDDGRNELDASSSFRCDGRTHCSQMTSCPEATFFIQHCPNTQMDGDGDGVACESQWCE